MHESSLEALLEAARSQPIAFDGLEIESAEDGFLFAVPGHARSGLDQEQLVEQVSRHPKYLSNWYVFTRPRAEPRTAFLRWIEGAEALEVPERYTRLRDGMSTRWGELLISATVHDGQRRYDLRHVEEEATPRDRLDTYEDPLEARALAKQDPSGRYRPLKSAPTLQAGWVFPELAPDELTATVEQFYPASIENWYLEREDALDVSHWRETMERQTGIYGVVETWDRGDGYDHVNWVTEAMCDDSQCLKRRRWEYDEETTLDTDPGAGAFPCREPCSLMVSAARRWTRLEGEQPERYQLTLTPSEKAQLERLIEAVADDELDEIREADLRDGANRYRARYLRAKRLDAEGQLDVEPADPS